MTYDWQTSQNIYNKYFVTAKKLGIVWTLWSYAAKQLNIVEVDEQYTSAEEYQIEDYINKIPKDEADLLQELLADEITFFIYRHLNGPWGEMVDHYKWRINIAREKYREVYNKESPNDIEVLY